VSLLLILICCNILGFLAVALELCEKGSLKGELDKLRSGDYKIIDKHVEISQVKVNLGKLLPKLLKWCEEVASGMEHLEKLTVRHATVRP